MRKCRFTDEQTVAVLHEVGAGAKITQVCRRHGINDTTFQRWRRKYGGLQGQRGQAAPGSRECLNETWFVSLADVRATIEAWLDATTGCDPIAASPIALHTKSCSPEGDQPAPFHPENQT